MHMKPDLPYFGTSRFDVECHILKDRDNKSYMFIYSIILLDDVNRRKGYGTKALKYLISVAKNEKCKYIILEADTNQKQNEGFILLDWYKKYGFYTTSPLNHLVKMRKDL